MANWIIQQTADLANGINADAFRRDIYPIAYIGDQNAHVWRVTVTNNGEPVNLANHTVTANFIREFDKATVTVVGSIDGSVVYVSLPREIYAYQCRVAGVLRLNRTGGSTTIAAIAFRVGANMTDTIIDPGEAIPDINVLLDEVERLEIANSQAENLVLVQETQPTEEANKLWVQPTEEEFVVPTMDELLAVEANKVDKPVSAGSAGDILTLKGDGKTEWKAPVTEGVPTAVNPTDPYVEILGGKYVLNNNAVTIDIVVQCLRDITAQTNYNVCMVIENVPKPINADLYASVPYNWYTPLSGYNETQNTSVLATVIRGPGIAIGPCSTGDIIHITGSYIRA